MTDQEIKDAVFGARVAIEEEKDRHKGAMAELKQKIKGIQELCSHPPDRTSFEQSASGNESWMYCTLCDKVL